MTDETRMDREPWVEDGTEMIYKSAAGYVSYRGPFWTTGIKRHGDQATIGLSFHAITWPEGEVMVGFKVAWWWRWCSFGVAWSRP